MNTTTTTTPALTKLGRALMTEIGDWHGSFFDGGIAEGEGIWFSCLTGETAGIEGLAKTPTGMANVITKLGQDGYLSIDGPDEDGEQWVSLTKLGAETALELAAIKRQADEHPPVELTSRRDELTREDETRRQARRMANLPAEGTTAPTYPHIDGYGKLTHRDAITGAPVQDQGGLTPRQRQLVLDFIQTELDEVGEDDMTDTDLYVGLQKAHRLLSQDPTTK